ncbi:MAG: winged helix DNA-binding protein [Nitrososphaerota archaeon]
MEYVTIFFAGLMAVQTIIFLIIFRRAVMQLDITRLEALAARLKEVESRLTMGVEKSVEARSPRVAETTLTTSALSALRLIYEKGSVTSSDVTSSLQLSREHVARLLKNLYEMGLVARDGKPFRYILTEKAKSLIASS